MTKRKADVLQQKSPAEFFAENKNIAGFDNVRVWGNVWYTWCKLSKREGLQSVVFAAAWQVLIHQCQRTSRKLSGCSGEYWPATRDWYYYVSSVIVVFLCSLGLVLWDDKDSD